MIPDSLRAQYLGKAINVDYADGQPFPPNQPFQCWDLVDRYSLDNGWGEATTGDGFAEGVYDLFRGSLSQFYDRIPYEPGFVAQCGDIPVWAPNVPGLTGEAGHIAIALGGDVNSMSVLEQNNPKPYVTEARRPYTGLLGVLRPKALNNQGEDMYQGRTAESWAKSAQDATNVAEDRAKYLAQLCAGAGVNPDHPLEQADIDRAVGFIDKLNKDKDRADRDVARLNGELTDALRQLEAAQAAVKPQTPTIPSSDPTGAPSGSGESTQAPTWFAGFVAWLKSLNSKK